MKKEYSIVILAISIAFSGFWIGNAIMHQQNSEVEVVNYQFVDEVLSLSEASDYLKISEKSIKAIISQEKTHLNNYGSFSGMMFPYSKVYGEYIFSKKSLDIWINESTTNRNEKE
ncbi:helix-turn-helix domain-containing protein [Psychrobacillus sp. INOP01]|uniref:helix-turn-helix domain-containing protein n=1 Tax=Psychrobacillus sp. INOP01 TaxID=2829187 RepID=UPI001BA89FC9|nr:helix-turn-helix domain-containing protein [Psychrobacillus sp. INOP01]QUG43064.1 helix-turn-helix domain-containing protein [Psychrobacillus sp. INOP01]